MCMLSFHFVMVCRWFFIFLYIILFLFNFFTESVQFCLSFVYICIAVGDPIITKVRMGSH